MTNSPLLTAKEAADYLRLKPGTLSHWRCEGKGPRFIGGGHGRRVTYRRSDLDAWIESEAKQWTGE